MDNSPNPEAPHQAVILVRHELNERNATGEMLPRSVKQGSKLYTFIGKDFATVDALLTQFLEGIQDEEKRINESQAE